ncbi:MAG: DUF58 domain-containing protein [Proteobacteria bacterium]|nr:DUF58 domain-containing protein [Pseudomonadota bacterium]
MRRRFILVFLLCLFLVLGLFAQRGELLIMMIPLLVFLGAGTLLKPKEIELTVSRSLEADHTSHGETVVVKLQATNRGSKLDEVVLLDILPARVELCEGNNRLLTTLEPGETVAWEYTLRVFRGNWRFQGLLATVGNPFGLFRKEFLIPAGKELSVRPEAKKLKRVVVRPRRTQFYTGTIPTRIGGSGIDFLGIREYQPGDSHRLINWKTMARHPDRLYSNEFEQERIASIGLIFDCRRQSYPVGNQELLLDCVSTQAAALADALISEGNRVGLLAYGDILDWTFLGSGKVHKERIIRAITNIRLNDRDVFRSLDRIPTRLFPPRSQLVVFSPLQKKDLKPLIHLQARGYQITIISPNPISFEWNDQPDTEDFRMADRILRMERKLMDRKLNRSGIHFIDWDMNVPFHRIVDRHFNRRSRPAFNLSKL